MTMSNQIIVIKTPPSGLRASLEAAIGKGGLPVLTPEALDYLRDELGGMDALADYLFGLVNKAQRPIGVHDGARTTFIGPRGWTNERLAGYISVHQEALSAAFGPVRELRAP